jgi:hypothetical protein
MKKHFTNAPVSVQNRLAKAVLKDDSRGEAREQSKTFKPKDSIVEEGTRVVLNLNLGSKEHKIIFADTEPASNFNTLNWSSDEE